MELSINNDIGGKLWTPRKGRQRPDRPDGRKHRRRDGRIAPASRKSVCKEHTFQIISVTTQVAISRPVHRYQLALRDRQATGGRREVNGIPLPMTWRWSIDEEWGIGLPREEAVNWRLQEGKEGYVPSQSDRENTGVLEDIRFILDQIMYDTLSEGEKSKK